MYLPEISRPDSLQYYLVPVEHRYPRNQSTGLLCSKKKALWH
jgi:hypothetical protein